MRVLLGVLVALAATSCSGDDGAGSGPGPGFALSGSLESSFTVHLYRFDGDVTVQLHPRSGDGLLRAPGAKEVCREQVCTPFVDDEATLDFDGVGDSHLTLRIRTDARVDEATLTYDAADNFLAVDFHR